MVLRTLRWVIVCLGLGAGLSGCASWFADDGKDPEVHLVSVQVVKAKLMQQRFVLHFRIDNPNDDSLTVSGLRYRVYLAGLLLADGEYDEWLSVDGHSSEPFDVPVRTNLWEHLRDVVKLLRHPDRPIPYRLEGELKTGLVFGREVVLRRSGEVVAKELIRH
ncbi:LEA type 2 family protein [Pseudomonas silvicola]|nr:LEA type 2 family protein [Pseudomonas silvicola]